ncbi:hypothetical protein B0H14DRAFT_3450578 [Mycena olivaceomarginata]|nr:hypothetical protein B0H14DRAFT_3450578 [Mycena olivaceomarginata]
MQVFDTAVAALSTTLDEFTVVDLFHLMHAHVFAHCTDIMTKKGRPNVARWRNELTSRPAWLEMQKEIQLQNK